MNKICFQIGSTGKEIEFSVEWELPKDKIKAETAIALSIQQFLSNINKCKPTNICFKDKDGNIIADRMELDKYMSLNYNEK